MEQRPVTVEEVRDAQENLKKGISQHENKDFKEAIESFKKSASIYPFDEQHLEQLQKKLKGGNYKKQHESIAYMGCAAVHLNQLIQQLDNDQKARVPVDQQLSEVFKDW
ncbi:MAG: hypothetical protein ACE5E9_12940 [Nitrospinaceae bacterium]